MLAVLIFLVSIIAANLLTTKFGPEMAVYNSFFLIGLDLTLRDKIHELWHGNRLKMKMFFLILSGALITYFLNRNSVMICIGSVSAFSVSLAVDAILYEKFYKFTVIKKINYSNIGSAVTDSIIFPTVAFGSIMPKIIIGMSLAKIVGGFVWSLILHGKYCPKN